MNRFSKIRQYSTLLQTAEKYSVPTYAKPSVILTKGKGAYLWDSNDNKYIDFSAGIAVTALGHSNPEITKILAEQSSQLMHCSNLFNNEWAPRLQESLVEETLKSGGMKGARKVFLANSGTEANEAALKFARKVGTLSSPDKTEFVNFEKAFHGRTMGALSVTPNPKYQAPFAPLVPGVKTGVYNDPKAADLITEKTCGVIVEPVQGEGGVYKANDEFLQALRNKCDEVGAMLIFDEIQCGLGRTGRLWAHDKVHPDILTMAKALGNGFPIGATMVTEAVADKIAIGDHGTTYGGNPLASRVGHYVLSQVASKEVLDNVKKVSQQIRDAVAEVQEEFPELITEVRGDGLLLGIQFSKDPSKVVAAARENGLLVITAGTNTVRLVPALNIDQEAVTEGLEILKKAIRDNAKDL
ncbi:mitochondrial acetylornithine aminotransferase [Yarrowia lipolytica]|jgi:acetylornithine aminotransferase|uniref:Acetylornithine aminotransferase, mitochondrial n=2 Tax=Yarrowia lipolytica TaxID=4952 RepID=ARGD_YARLI|nr:YALI0D22847p [Yarrowia lipolytica CLIB122]Q6C846.1 RecName: Full=Acetylornithine aminotransferase, mitochondrial; Short=ACOAT; Flags: Precursor [Yarrowia lipolytica CLIB122]AOW04491.1 hypothetical protein YALI1_D29419g [Yarrowia lipolytica]KAB8285707.1 mitochondrial acetylornithine aminotransferase [Yarrowia lipolytica]KAE8172582.1 mitochondrial acetylornithine aminotransferase [Yarrowia lipolytica]KAJ8054049.1 mitochondrial acetylornithine aminotransferase [Yarrowia lipolytica]QNP98038.1 |eukprot:XP_503166.1 YALI0D22847p [Yarrowia lipolytica CLIB122]